MTKPKFKSTVNKEERSRIIIDWLWKHVNTPFTVDELSQAVRQQGGVDMTPTQASNWLTWRIRNQRKGAVTNNGHVNGLRRIDKGTYIFEPPKLEDPELVRLLAEEEEIERRFNEQAKQDQQDTLDELLHQSIAAPPMTASFIAPARVEKWARTFTELAGPDSAGEYVLQASDGTIWFAYRVGRIKE